jgi:uncharacterized protein with von Willebrand factor type A (vWA) domain
MSHRLDLDIPPCPPAAPLRDALHAVASNLVGDVLSGRYVAPDNATPAYYKRCQDNADALIALATRINEISREVGMLERRPIGL